jgi:hypothetical protein
MKMFLSRNEAGIVEGAGGYIMGDGQLPSDFNPDEFMKRFSHATIMAAARGNKQAVERILAELPTVEAELVTEVCAEIDEQAKAAADRVAASIDAAPVCVLEDGARIGEQAVKYIEDLEV